MDTSAYAIQAPDQAATLTKGSSSDGVSYPGRRKEDDENLVAVTPLDRRNALRGSGESGDGTPSTGVGVEGDPAYTVSSVPQAVAFTKTHGAQDVEDAELWNEAAEVRSLNGMGYATDVVVESLDTYNQQLGGDLAPTLRDPNGTFGDALPAVMFSISPEEGQGADLRAVETDVSPGLSASGSKLGDRGVRVVEGVAATLKSRTGNGKTGVGLRTTDVDQTMVVDSVARAAVRRLTPRECERLQGFPDDWTDIPGASDGPRYAALGDAVTVNVAYWIAARIRRKIELARAS